MHKKAFTFRSLVFGIVGLLLVAVFPIYSAKVLDLPDAIRGYLPAVPLIVVVILSFAWNGIAGRLNRRLALSGPELAVVFCLMAMVSWLPDLQMNMVRQMALPRYEELTTNASWKEAGVTTRLPDRLFPAGENGERVGEHTHFGMIQGGVDRDKIPYGAWVAPLLNWMPFLLMFVVCLMALTFMVHRQWTRHEQLRYPLADVVDSLIKQDGSNPGGVLLRNRVFWFGFGIVFVLNLLVYLNGWFPNKLPKIPTEYSLAWAKLFPSINASNSKAFVLGWMPIHAALIGIAFLVPADVSLSVGITAPLATFLGVQYYLLTGNQVATGDLESVRAGGFIAFGLILAYTGRTYYFPVICKAVWPSAKASTEDPGAVWAARVFLATYVALVAITATMGVGLLAAWVIVTFVLLVFLVVTRLVCETGLPTITAGWSMPTVLSGLFGTAALSAGPIMFLLFLGSTITSATSSTLIMPYMATSLKVLDDNDVNLGRFVVASKVAILVALVAGFVAVITLAYTEGAGNLLRTERGIWTSGVRQVLSLKDFGQYEASEAAHGLAKVKLVRPDGKTMSLVVTGLLAVVGCYLLRFRFAKWPLHPLFFVVVGSTMVNMAWLNFLLGWALKSLVIKIGGGRVYRQTKPLFVGFIVGEFAVVAITLIVGAIYYSVTGSSPVVHR